MAIDPRIPMMGITPDIAGAMSQGLLSGERLAQAPIRNQMLQQQVDMQSQQMQLTPLQLQAAQQTIALNEGSLSDAEQARNANINAYKYKLAESLFPLPPEQRAEAIEGARSEIESMGIDVDRMLSKLSDGDLTQAMVTLKPFSQMGMEGLTAGQREFQSMTEGLTPEQANLARRIKLGLDPRAVTRADTIEMIGGVPHIFDEQTNSMYPVRVGGSQVTPESVASSLATVSEGKTLGAGTGTGKAARVSERIEWGTDAAKAIPTLRRSLALLDRVSTGGVDALSLSVRRSLGVEGADEGELSNKLGVAVLTQLKPLFGAAFSEKEGARLDNISAGFTKSTATNRRLLSDLLQSSEKYAKQAITDALSIEDYETAAAIKSAMNYEFDEDIDMFGGATQGNSQGLKNNAITITDNPLVDDQASFNALPSGTIYNEIDDNGQLKTYVKP